MNESRVELEKHVWDTSETEYDSTKELANFLSNMDARIKVLEEFVVNLQKEKLKEKLDTKNISKIVINEINKGFAKT